MNNYKIKVNDEAESKEARDLFRALGYSPDSSRYGDYVALVAVFEDGSGSFYSSDANLEECQELTLPQLRDLVVLHRNNVNDATHTDGERNGFLSSDGVEYFWNAYDLEWFKAKQMTFAYEKFKPIQEQGLISGADALRALADGKEVEYWCENDPSIQKRWTLINNLNEYKLSYFLEDKPRFEFRLKPRTIKLSLWIPSPFEPKDGEEFFILAPLSATGYTRVQGITTQVLLDEYVKLGAWRTEEEIKQVVAALRGGIKG